MMKMSPLVLAALAAFVLPSPALDLSDAELASIGRRVWQNECGGTRDGLTSWNEGESFASLGIGHFIWYPKGAAGPFEESFPKLVSYFSEHGIKVPAWLRGPCVWASRAEFQAEFRGARLNELRDLLASTILMQSRFLAERLRRALPKLLDAAPPGERDQIRSQFERLTGTGAGVFALIDYVNFKGEGTNPKERYRGEGWGLLQVLAGMRGNGATGAAQEFGRSAEAVLARRVKNAPAERNEQRWLAGWRKRVRSYGD